MEEAAALLTKLDERLISALRDEHKDPKDRLNLAEDILDKFERFGEDSLAVLTAVEIQAALGSEQKNPIEIYVMLKKIAEQALVVEPPISNAFGHEAHLEVKSFRSLAVTMTRAMLPQNVTKEAFENLYASLKNKIVDVWGNEETYHNGALEALKELDENLEWNIIAYPYFDDPENYLKNLLTATGKVTDEEAKFKAVINVLLKTDNHVAEEQFFSPREEMLIKMMQGIQNCDGGKKYGISFAYNGLDSASKYKLKLQTTLTPDEENRLANKNEALIEMGMVQSRVTAWGNRCRRLRQCDLPRGNTLALLPRGKTH